MDELKKQLKELSKTPEIYRKITIIGDRYNLLLDTQDELTAETQDVIRGYKPAKDFVKNIKNRLEITNEEAEKIAADINIEIFKDLQNKLQQLQNESNQFTPDKPPIGMGGYATTQTPTPSIDREAVLKGIEDPITASHEESEITMTDHLLSSPVNTVSEVEIKKIEVKKPTAISDKKPSILDPYREQL